MGSRVRGNEKTLSSPGGSGARSPKGKSHKDPQVIIGDFEGGQTIGGDCQRHRRRELIAGRRRRRRRRGSD